MDKWMVRRKYMVEAISRYSKEYVKPCSIYSRTFDTYSYSTWALRELRTYILDHRNREPVELLREFIDKMDKASTMYKDADTGYCFSVAKDTAEYVYDMMVLGSCLVK